MNLHLTPRRRAALAILLSWPLAYFFVDLWVALALDLARYARGGYGGCTGSWHNYFNSCTAYNPVVAIVELVVLLAIATGLALLAARWALRPVRDIAATVGRFGPTSIGLRLDQGGPRDETRAAADEIDAMLGRLAEGYEAQRRFASNASHELRTPLATQRALIEISLTRDLTPDQLELLSRQLLSTNERNERLIDGLLTLAETDRGVMTRSRVAWDRTVTEAAHLLQPLAAERGLELHCRTAPVAVDGEQALLERLVSNLVHNAIKYNEPGGRVEVDAGADGADAVLTVTNTGPHVDAGTVPGLFEPFRRLSGERLDHGGGVGLGLTIARSIVAAHDGSIEAVPGPDGGLVVTVRLAARSTPRHHTQEF